MMKSSLIALSCGLSLAILGLAASPSLAQENEDIYQSNENSTTFGGNENFNPFDLIHNSRLNGGRNAAEFNSESGENISNAAASYRQQLLQYLKTQKQTSESPVIPDAAVETTPTETDSTM
ncbi:MAG: hypothetical protein WBB82_01125 [Limnothrix sp.]